MYQLFVQTSLLTALLSLVISLYVFTRNPRSPAHIKWAIVTLLVAVWSLSLFGVITASSKGIASTWQTILNLTAIFIPAIYLDFICSALGLRGMRLVKSAAYVLALLIAVVSLFKDFTRDLQPFHDFPFWIVPGKWYGLMPAFFTAVVGYCIYLLWREFQVSGGFKKVQAKYILLATMLGFGSGVTNFFPQLFNVYPFGNYFTWVYVLVISYYLVKVDRY